MFQLIVSLNVSICNCESFNHRKMKQSQDTIKMIVFDWIFQSSQFEIFKAETSMKMKWNIIYGGFELDLWIDIAKYSKKVQKKPSKLFTLVLKGFSINALMLCQALVSVTVIVFFANFMIYLQKIAIFLNNWKFLKNN